MAFFHRRFSPDLFGRLILAVALLAVLIGIPGTPAQAAINTSVTAIELAQAMAVDPSIITGASFISRAGANGTNSSVAVADTALSTFPLHGNSYAILSTGRAGAVESGSPDPTNDLGGTNVRGDTDFDVTILKIDLNVPAGRNCVAFNFRFLSSEFPEFVGTEYNDAFLAELNTSNWSTNGSAITAPNNFAYDAANNPISINATGAAVMNSANAAGTVFGDTFQGNPYSPYGATPILQTNTSITPGAHSLYLSIFDQGDNVKDSAVFIDNLYLGSNATGACQPGVTTPRDVTLTKAFGQSSITAGSSTTLTFTITNNSGNPARSGIQFTDTLPGAGGIVFTSTPTTTCPTGTATISGNSQAITFTNGSLNASQASCTVTATVQGVNASTYVNDSLRVSNTAKINASTVNATLTVTTASASASLTKQFIRGTIGAGGTATLRFTIANGSGNPAQSNLGFTDTLPTGLTVSGTPTTPQCGGTVTASGGVIVVSGASLASGVASCQINVTVTSSTLGTYVNNSSNISAVTGGLNTSGVNATLLVVSNAALTKAFSPTSIIVNATSTLTFTITNGTGNPARTDMDFTDTLPTGLVVSGTPAASQCGGSVAATGGVINFTNGTMTQGQTTCTITLNVTSTTPGTYVNNSGNISNLSGALLAGGVNATLTVTGPAFSSVPPRTQTVIVGGFANRPVTATIAVTNTGATGTTLTVTQVSNSNPSVFTIGGLPISVNQGAAAQNITVRCTPLANNIRTGTLTVQTNEGGSPSYVFNLSCRALPQTVGVFRPSTNFFHVRTTNTAGFASFSASLGAANDLPIVGDWNNDGIETPGIYRPSTGQFLLKDSYAPGAPVVYSFIFGNPGDLPVAGDWNGDGIDSIGVFRPSTGRFFLRNALSAGAPDFAVVFGTTGDVPLVGDWDGDGVDSPAYWRSSTQRFFFTQQVCNCTPTLVGPVWYGLPGDRPVAGDWNGDGISGVGVFRPSNLNFYLKNDPIVGNFANLVFQYGLSADAPLGGIWAYTNGTSTPSAPEFEAPAGSPAETGAPEFKPGK